MNDLRQLAKLNKSVDKQLSKLGLLPQGSEGESLDETKVSHDDKTRSSRKVKSHKKGKSSKERKVALKIDVSDTSESSESDSEVQRKNVRQKITSGIKAKSSDKVKKQLLWPQSALQLEFVNDHIDYHNLNMQQFVAGELEIILNGNIDDEEKQGRLELLKKIMYYSHVYSWKGLLTFYAAWLRKIELGQKCWSDDPSCIEVPVLTPFLANKSSPEKLIPESPQTREVSVWFCTLYNRNRCTHRTSTHSAVIQGRTREVHHICAICWRKDRNRLSHPECSTACPHFPEHH